ncbi:MAG: YdeI/OmpD-associated family protein [Acidobacteriaceae bacterium]|nr:YdeI/OmpD-associated family protein [Acidobacteriaceae bacterium]
MKSTSPSEEALSFANEKAWAKWLGANHDKSAGAWLRLTKKGSSAKSLMYAQALEVALCYGWIDAQKRGETEETWLQRFTPRGKRSIWSKINRDKALALIESGRMQPSGLEEVERARADGRWEAAYAGQRTIEVPDDLQTALHAKPKAEAFFRTLDSANRYAVLWRIHTAKKPETRAERIARFVDMLARGEKLH